MHLPPRLHIGLAATLLVGAALAGCTSSDGGATGSSSGTRAAASTATGPAPTASSRTGSTTADGSPTAASSSARRATEPPTEPPGTVTLAFAGDVHFADRVGARLARDPATVFAEAAPGLRRADLTMVNLETAVTTGGVQQAKAFTFRAPPVALTALRDAGVDVATMANNHGADYGAPGLADTLRAVRERHLPVIGIGVDADAAFAPYTTTINGVRLAIFAADQVHDETTLPLFSAAPGRAGVANADDPRLLDAVRAARRSGYVVIVYLHWGVEYQTCPSSDQTGLADRLAAAGATAVVGTHAHVLQGAGWRPDGTYVAYGLGNYLWWMSFGNNQDDNGVLTLTLNRDRVAQAHFVPSHLDDRGVPVPATGSQRDRILAEWATDRQCAGLSGRPPG